MAFETNVVKLRKDTRSDIYPVRIVVCTMENELSSASVTGIYFMVPHENVTCNVFSQLVPFMTSSVTSPSPSLARSVFGASDTAVSSQGVPVQTYLALLDLIQILPYKLWKL